MVSTQSISPSAQQPAHLSFKPITYTPHQVAKMARFANESPDFVRATVPHFTQEHLGYYLGMLVEQESPFIPRCIATYFNLQPNRQGGFTWKVQ